MKNILKSPMFLPDKENIKALVISYLLINFTFLYHTLNLMWGNHDVVFIKERLFWDSGLFEGRFTQFIPHILLTDGQILPIVTNLLGFAFLTYGLWLLAKYWNIPNNTLNNVLFITFFTTLPYTLSWLYFTFITLSCLLWVLCVILGLHISQYIFKSTHKFRLSLLAVLCFYLPLGGYPPVINTIFVCFTAKITFDYIFEESNLKTLLNTYKYTLFNIIIASVLVQITLKFVRPDNVYNLELTPIADIPQKFLSTLIISAKQFSLSLPFMEKGYKIILAVMSLFAFITAILNTPTLKKRILSTLFILSTVWCAALTTFLVVPHTEYVARIDFYGLGFVYAFALALLLISKTPIIRSIALILMLILIPLNIKNDYRAQKIWQQGFTAEMKILDDVIERIENHPQFNPHQTYRFYQIGDITLRPTYYRQKFEYPEPFLLDLPYLAMWQGGRLAEFYSPFNYINHQSSLLNEDITKEVYDFMMNKASPWPHQNSVYINQNIIIVIYHEGSLDSFKQILKQQYFKN